MLGQAGKGEINLNCSERAFPEFPNLLVGTQTDSGVAYFDATVYLNKSKSGKPMQDFFVKYRYQLLALSEAYDIPFDKICLINANGHHLIDINFVYLFLSFAEPGFLAYMCDRIHELFTDGVAVSDTYLLRSASSRLSKEALNIIIKDETNSQLNA